MRGNLRESCRRRAHTRRRAQFVAYASSVLQEKQGYRQREQKNSVARSPLESEVQVEVLRRSFNEIAETPCAAEDGTTEEGMFYSRYLMLIGALAHCPLPLSLPTLLAQRFHARDMSCTARCCC